ncbi:MAG: cyanophycinase [Armatimonadota bacterium]
MKILSLVIILASSGSAPRVDTFHLSPYGVEPSFVIVSKSASQASTPTEGSKTKILVQADDAAPEGFQYLKSSTDEPNPGLIGIYLTENCEFSVDRRVMKSTQQDSVILRLAKSPTRPARTLELTKGVKADYNEWRRCAIQRTAKVEWPPKKPGEPRVPKGTLVIVGGGGMTKEIANAFIDAGGGDSGHFVVLPISMPDPINIAAEEESMHRMGLKNVTVIPYREKSQLEDPKVVESLKKATGIWFGGGRQWNFVDAYEGTKLPALFKDVLNRGGVIGGSSAGATIIGDYMVRGAPAGPGLMMCEGYEQAMGFLPGVAIDQHFSARNRFKDMTGLMSTYPQFLGIGLDEATAIVVKGSVAEVLGRGNAHFYGSKKIRIPEAPDFDALPAGSKYDLVTRKFIK